MKVLALELSTVRGSLAWLNGDVGESGGRLGAKRVDLVREWSNDRKHSGFFFENLAEMQKQFGLPETIIVGLGPGSYAGTRIAISAAIGLRASGGTGSVPSVKATGRHGGRPSTSVCVQLVGYPSICAVETEENEYCMIGDARRSTFFFARIRINDLVEGPTLLGEAELKEKLDKLEDKMPIFSSEPLPQFERAAVRYPSAQVLARLAQDPGRSFSLPPLEPMYLREPHITMPRSAPIT
jgi:tRNA threonylcarbamoyladenosine biosynthesis protein TsaB